MMCRRKSTNSDTRSKGRRWEEDGSTYTYNYVLVGTGAIPCQISFGGAITVKVEGLFAVQLERISLYETPVRTESAVLLSTDLEIGRLFGQL